MTSFVRTKAICLKATKYGEADLIIQALTSKGDKVSLLARGALKSKKRFAGGVLEPTHYLEMQYKQSQNPTGLGTLQDAQIVDAFQPIRSDYDRLALSLFVIECAGRVSQEGDSFSEGLFDLVGNSLKALETVSNLKLFRMHFALKLLYQQGVLEPEAWMSVYLKMPMTSSEKLNEVVDPTSAQVYWIENQLEAYIRHGE